jgi:hypothetical protein
VKHATLALVVSLAAAALGGCASAPQERFYALSPVAGAEPAADKVGYSVAVGPVSVPEMVDRQQMVVRNDANRVTLLEQTRWAEPLASGIGRVIAANLGQLLGSAQVAVYPQSAASDADYRVAVDVQRFESVPGGTAGIDVLWSVRDAKGVLLRAGRSSISEPTGGSDTVALVAAHDRALAAVSRDIALALRASRPAS